MNEVVSRHLKSSGRQPSHEFPLWRHAVRLEFGTGLFERHAFAGFVEDLVARSKVNSESARDCYFGISEARTMNRFGARPMKPNG